MLLSIALMFLTGMGFGKFLEKLKLPRLLGMLLSGILLGPYVLNLIDIKILDISTELRQIALIIILVRAGLNLDINDLKRVGRPALLMCFVPACFEIIGMLILAPKLLGISLLEAAIMGSVIAAVSPAVIVPRMLGLIENGYGKDKGVPQMIMAGASVDDVFVIVLFTTFTSLAQGDGIGFSNFIDIPVSIILGIIIGMILGLALSFLFTNVHIRDTGKIMIILSVSFLLVAAEDIVTNFVGFSSMIAVMALGVAMAQNKYKLSKRLSDKFSKLWVGAEIFLFVLVGATVNISYVLNAGLISFILIIGVLLFRMLGVFISLISSNLNKKERFFSALAYMPKATVQAAIGGLPLAMGLACGEIVLTVAVVSIMLTAPVGAMLIDMTYHKFLSADK